MMGGGNFNFGWDVGPAEFLSLIKYADHVFTDSFHGTVFSILFEKEFTVFERAKRSGKVNMNSRLTDLLETFNLKEMLVSDDEFPSHHPECNYTQIDAKLDKLRKESLAWLKNSIEG